MFPILLLMTVAVEVALNADVRCHVVGDVWCMNF